MANLDQAPRPFISSGCVDRPVRIFGGVRNDIEWVKNGIGFPESIGTYQSSATSQRHKSKRTHASFGDDPAGVVSGMPIFGYFAFIDPVLSFIGDTLTLPQVLKAIHDAEGDQCIAEESTASE